MAGGTAHPGRPAPIVAAVAMLAAVILTACGRFGRPPASAPGEPAPPPLPSPTGALYGRVLTSEGRGAAGTGVRLAQVEGDRSPTAAFALGFGCLIPDACGYRASARTQADGTYAFSHGDVRSGRRSVVVAAFPAAGTGWAGPQTSAAVTPGPRPQEAPDLIAWDPHLNFSSGGADLRIRWPALTGLLRGPHVTYTVDALLGKTGTPLLRLSGPTPSTEAVVDAREFEDQAYQVVVVAHTDVELDGREVSFSYRSAARRPPAGAGAAPSRGRPCLTDDAAGALHPVAPCPLTDGDLERPAQVSHPPCPGAGAGCVQVHRRICVDMGDVRPVGLVVYRTPFRYDDAAVELSVDGVAFAAVGRPDPRPPGNAEVFTVAVPAGSTARVVCVSGAFTGAALREVSVW